MLAPHPRGLPLQYESWKAKRPAGQLRWAVRRVLEKAQDGLRCFHTHTATRGRLPALDLGGRAALDTLCDQLSEWPNVLIQARTVQRGKVPGPVFQANDGPGVAA
jgi:hypothetical protein